MAVDIALIKTISPSRRQGLGSTPSYHGAEGASQTFKRGAPLVFNSAGYLVEASNPIDPAEQIVGFARSNGQNGSAGANDIVYTPALPHVIFEGVLEDGTNFLHSLAQTNVGESFNIAKDTASGAWFLDENVPGDACALVIELVDAVATAPGRVRFIVLPSRTVYF